MRELLTKIGYCAFVGIAFVSGLGWGLSFDERVQRGLQNVDRAGVVLRDRSHAVGIGAYEAWDCGGCHGGPRLVGVRVFPNGVKAPNLTSLQWSVDDCMAFFATGRPFNGEQVSPIMPWKVVHESLLGSDQRAICSFLNALVPQSDGPEYSPH